MKVWKSPVFYFGILLVMAVAGLLAAPFIIDWNGYRADLEAYGKKLTGRTVTIAGPISARLFPWPRLTAEDIHIANPPGLETAEFARAERIVVSMKLMGLVKGAIDVESIAIDAPDIGFERLPTGDGNWTFSPAADLVKSELLSRVSLDSIKLNNGTIRIRDRRRGETIELRDFNASIASPGVTGPWRMQSVSLYGDRALDIGLTTGTWKADEPFRFGVRVAAADGSGLAFGFDGTQANGEADGELRIEPAAAGDSKSDAEGQFRPLVFTSKVKATFDQVDFQTIEIAPRDPASGGAVTTGTARLTLGRHIAARVELNSAALDLDELAGAGSRSLLREAGGLALADSFLSVLPKDMSLSADFKVTALRSGGEMLDNVELTVEADRNAIRIGRFSAGLPGRSKGLFKGVYFPDSSGAELAGTLAIESNDLRQLTMWAWPEGKTGIDATWTGSRGRFKMETFLSLTQSRLRLSKAAYEIDGETGVAQLSITAGGRGSVDLLIDSKRIDIDNFIPQGVSTFADGKNGGIGGLVTLALPHKEAPDLRLTLQAAELRLNGVSAADVALDLASGANGLDLRTLVIGSVGGARLEATGLILDSGQGADGSIGVDIKADDPRELLRLMGMIRGDESPAWSNGLGPTAISGNFTMKPDAKGSAMSFILAGDAGVLKISASGEIGAGLEMNGQASVASPNSGRLMELVGLMPVVPDTAPGKIEIKAAGSKSGGFLATAELHGYGTRADYNGDVNPLVAGFGLDGKLAIRSTDVQILAEAMGLPAAQPPHGVLVLDTSLVTKAGGWSLPDLNGRLGASKVSGTLSFDAGSKMEGHLEAGNMELQDVLAAVFLNWEGASPTLETGFAASLPFGLTGELWIKPASLAIQQHFVAREAEIGIMASGDEIRLALFGKDAAGRDAHVEVSSRGSDGSRKLEGKINLPLNLQSQLLLAGGAPIAEGQGLIDVQFEADGRSTGGALAGLRGTGSFGFDGLRLLGLTPEDFAKQLAEAKDGAGVTAAFDALRGGAGLLFGKVGGSISIANGEVTFLPIKIRAADADVEIRTAAELALGEIDVDIAVQLNARPSLPMMNITYAGPPSALARNEDNAELATKLGITLMQQGVDELERLQREQQRLAAEEEKQRILDEARLQAYYAQRDELLLRKREVKVHAEMVVIEAERLRRQLEAERAANLEISKSEIKQRAREIRIHRRLARLSSATPVDVPAAKPKQTRRASVAAKPPKQNVGPVILEQPAGAPVLISPDPSAPPSQ